MIGSNSLLIPQADWSALPDVVRGRTALIIGSPGTGKSRFARWLAEQIAAHGPSVALVSADMGQPSVGVPTCLGLALAPKFEKPAALWFIGDTTPRGNLLPSVVGTARLVERARELGAETILIDTSGYVDGPAARLLKYHKLLATGAALVFALQRRRELEPLLGLLASVCPEIHRLEASPAARDRTAARRQSGREALYRRYLDDARTVELPLARIVDAEWDGPRSASAFQALPGTVVGLIDERGFCLGIGVLESSEGDRVSIYTAAPEASRAASLRLGQLRLDRRAGFAECR